ncbi:contact-dependent growth inhibition system immunity protein [uncultured Enterococcus sp.]|uniref:contact-dependent growth inhibition system immunity protein n=1 Tax=uncultured Enterococcus sp. TaxID=167972 RepID=UPI002AA9606C|nr:contact-dependent growth inhibition system immunity protein [uncultured Enterococcus sp.]
MNGFEGKETLENFLQANFHQDISSIDEAIDEILNEEETDYLIEITRDLDWFLHSTIIDETKISFIKSNTDIYFEKDKEYISFLKDIMDKINLYLSDNS